MSPKVKLNEKPAETQEKTKSGEKAAVTEPAADEKLPKPQQILTKKKPDPISLPPKMETTPPMSPKPKLPIKKPPEPQEPAEIAKKGGKFVFPILKKPIPKIFSKSAPQSPSPVEPPTNKKFPFAGKLPLAASKSTESVPPKEPTPPKADEIPPKVDDAAAEVIVQECESCQTASDNASSLNDNANNNLVKNKFTTVTDDLHKLSSSVSSDQQSNNAKRPSQSEVETTSDYSESGDESGVEGSEDYSDEDEMPDDKPKKFDPKKKIKLNFENMKKCYVREEKSKIIMVARPRPLWKIKRGLHKQKNADLTSSSSDSDDSDDDSSARTSQTSETSETAGSSLNSSTKSMETAALSASAGKVGDYSDIYSSLISPLHSARKDENNNEDNENNKNVANKDFRTASTSSHDSGYFGGTAPISPKKALGKSACLVCGEMYGNVVVMWNQNCKPLQCDMSASLCLKEHKQNGELEGEEKMNIFKTHSTPHQFFCMFLLLHTQSYLQSSQIFVYF
jgi:hypothetical protein